MNTNIMMRHPEFEPATGATWFGTFGVHRVVFVEGEGSVTVITPACGFGGPAFQPETFSQFDDIEQALEYCEGFRCSNCVALGMYQGLMYLNGT